MKLIKREKDKLLFHLGRREKGLLIQLFQLFPQMPSDYSGLSKSGNTDPSSQQLLEESLAEHRAEQQQHIARLIHNPSRWSEHHHGWQLTLEASEVEWLLQVLNDIRVGSWIRLGSPEHTLEAIDEKSAPHLWAMEIAGSFEISLLHTLEAPEKQ